MRPIDPRVQAVIAIGPWGRNRDFWDGDGLAGFGKPLLLVAGGVDDVSEYPAIREIFEETTGTDRYLLTFEGANHDAAVRSRRRTRRGRCRRRWDTPRSGTTPTPSGTTCG